MIFHNFFPGLFDRAIDTDIKRLQDVGGMGRKAIQMYPFLLGNPDQLQG